MNGLTTKVTLYDLLSMIIPGYLILYLLKSVFFSEYTKECDELTYVVVVFAMSYIVGMAIHQVAKFLFSSLRNHKCIIKISWEKFRKANNLPFSPEEFKSDDYYEAYYTASTYSWSSVPVLESQYSFLRSMILVEIAYLISGCSIDLTACQISLIALVFIITIILAGKYLYLTSYRVWEDAYFMKKIGQKKII